MDTSLLHSSENPSHSFFHAYKKRPHHAWILRGPKGIGKLVCAKEITASLLSKHDPAANIDIKIHHQNHPNFLYISPEASETKTISIEQIRTIAHFVTQTSAHGGEKIVILNSLNDMTINSMNGLLKILEAPPPQTLFLLIHHNGKPILPTVMSRCASLTFSPLEDKSLEPLIPEELKEEDRQILLFLAHGCPNRLKELLDLDGVGFYHSFQRVLNGLLRSSNYEPVHAFAQTVGKDPLKLEMFMTLIEGWLQRAIREAALNRFSFFDKSYSLSSLLNCHREISHLIGSKKNLDLDGRGFILTLFFELKRLQPL